MTDTIRVHLFLNEKGGVGKTIAAVLCIGFLLETRESLVICEADPEASDLSRICEEKQAFVVYYPYFTTDETRIDEADILIEAVFEHQTDVIVNCPAQSLKAVINFFAQGSAESTEDEEIEFLIWYVTDGTEQSMVHFYPTVEQLPDIQFIFVRNHLQKKDNPYDFSNPETNEQLEQVLAERDIPVVVIPNFPKVAEHLKVHGLTFDEAFQDSELTRATRSRARRQYKAYLDQLRKLEVLADGAKVD